MNFGSHASESDSFRIMDEAHGLGINFFDTANVYGGKAAPGATEAIVGKWFAAGGGRREKTVLATKVYGFMDEWPNESRLSAYHIQRACEASLKRLRTDTIDLYQMHHIDRKTPWDEIWQAMDVLIKQGKILYTGSSNFAAWHIAEANASAREKHLLGLVSEQGLYNLCERTAELEVLPHCEARGVGFLPWSPLAGGLLAGLGSKKNEGRRGSKHVQELLSKHQSKINQYEPLCQELSEDPAIVGLAWLLSRPGVTAPIIGPRVLDQLKSSTRALELTLSDDILKKLDEIFPGPGGAAPEAYAW